ncbi:MAG: diguanylate cyclase (GGDEF)-like protein [Candidatus Poriferisodalaceae bacterium]|jgi:diguanylate cyclase (GGDEF)-like protein
MLGCLVGDAFVLWLVLTVFVTDIKDSKTNLVAVGLALHVTVDILHSAALGPGSPLRMTVGNVTLLFAFALWLIALRIPLRETSATATERLAVFRATSLMFALITPTALIASRMQGRQRYEAVLAVVTAALAALFASRRIKGLLLLLSATNAELAHRSHHDYLTNDRTSPLRAVVYLDLNRFKPVNDELGHDAGDAVLIEVAARLTQAVRGSDKVVRIGGDEFVVLVTDAETDLQAFTTRLDRVLNAEASLDGDATANDALSTAEDLLARADKAMLETKAVHKATAL